MQKSAYLVNVARPGVLVKEDLVEKLKNKEIAGAAIDVHEPKPLPAGDPLVQLDNAICTPWVGYNTHDACDKMSKGAVANLISVLQGKGPIFPVNNL